MRRRALRPWLQLMRLDRPIGTWLLFWPCVFGLVLGAAADERRFLEWRDLYYVVLFGIGAAGDARRRLHLQRHRRPQDRRRRWRAPAAGPFRPAPSACARRVLFLIALCLIGLVILLQFNLVRRGLGAASLLLVAAYPFMKRITWWPQAWLGLTFNWGALLGFAAQTGRLDVADVMLYAGLFFWTLGYDTIYAHQDKEDDELIGVKSTARLFGADRAQMDSALLRHRLHPDPGRRLHRTYRLALRLCAAAGRRASAVAGQAAGHRRSRQLPACSSAPTARPGA